MPRHTNPSPVYPALQAQLNGSALLMALAERLCVLVLPLMLLPKLNGEEVTLVALEMIPSMVHLFAVAFSGVLLVGKVRIDAAFAGDIDNTFVIGK